MTLYPLGSKFENMLTTVLQKVDSYLKNESGPYFAAFDADGTLWANDVGENFFQYQIDHCDLESLRKKKDTQKNSFDPWKNYLELKKKHPPTAYLWLAQLCQNYSLSEVESWSIAAAQKHKPLLFPQQRALVAELLQRKITVYVVSASVEWAVNGALKVAGLHDVSAIGVKTKIVNGTVSDEQDGFITWRKGKEDALLAKTNGVAPLLSCGNTLGDQHLIEMSKSIKIAIQSQKSTSLHQSLYKDEQALLALAQKNNWLTFDFS